MARILLLVGLGLACLILVAGTVMDGLAVLGCAALTAGLILGTASQSARE